MAEPNLAGTTDALARCETVVARLHKMCCEPDRSPRMIEITETLLAIRGDLDTGDQPSLHRTLQRLEQVGKAVGHLQVGCCTEARMPLYAETLTLLNRIQLDVNQQLGLGH